jgi:multiple sugar transport system substrate-binding protein
MTLVAAMLIVGLVIGAGVMYYMAPSDDGVDVSQEVEELKQQIEQLQEFSMPQEPFELMLLLDADIIKYDWHQAINKQYQETYPLCTEITSPGSQEEWVATVMTAIQSDSPIDVALAQDAWQLGERGGYMDLTPFIEQYSRKDDVLTGYESFTLGDAIYGMPNLALSYQIFYNKNAFDKAGVPYWTEPNITWDEFLDLAQALTKDFDGDGVTDQYGIAMFHRTDYRMGGVIAWLLGNGGRLWSEDWETPMWNTPEMIETAQYLQDLVYKYEVSPVPTAGSAGFRDSRSLFIDEKAAMVISYTGFFRGFSSGNPNLVDNWGVINIPYNKNPIGIMFGAGMTIVSNSENPYAAWKWIELYNSDKYTLQAAKETAWIPGYASLINDWKVAEEYGDFTPLKELIPHISEASVGLFKAGQWNPSHPQADEYFKTAMEAILTQEADVQTTLDQAVADALASMQ